MIILRSIVSFCLSVIMLIMFLVWRTTEEPTAVINGTVIVLTLVLGMALILMWV